MHANPAMAYRSYVSLEPMVIEDGTDQIESGSRERPGWLLVAVAFGLGLALGTIIASPGGVPDPGGATQTTVATAVTDPLEVVPDAGVAGAVPDFPDALVAIADGVGSGHDYLLWPVAGDLVTRSITGGRDVRLDAGGQFLALSDVVPDLPGSLLSMGRFNGMRSIASGVTSYAWHDSSTGQLAYTTQDAEQWHLYRVSSGFDPSLVASGRGQASIATWGEWGYALQLPAARVRLLTNAGEPKGLEAGKALGSHDSGWILFEDDGLKLVSAGGGVRRLGDIAPQRILGAWFSPSGEQVAVVGELGVIVLSLEGEVLAKPEPTFQGQWVTWSSDSRFVIAPAPRGVVVHDLESGESYRVLQSHDILIAQVLPLSRS